jgi:alpha-amylase/alpha-mannosidase (GH57 family)
MDPQAPKYICIHGHFYQPPRENPWLEAIEVQDSAYPYHDWNERITSECYAPNAASRILDPDSKIIDIINNYSKISFNFGPTLLSWMKNKTPDIYKAILDADRESMKYFSGHGSAIAQVYNHMILPLANSHDKLTQVIWGIRDFESRFGRKPEGMWLAETAVDLETLEILADQGIKFTILAPHQAHQVRKIGTGPWRDISGNRIDTRQPYLCNLASGRVIHLFFYDTAIAKETAFGNLLSNGEQFASRLMSALVPDSLNPQLEHIATDGETYGHHFKRADMALAYCIYDIETKQYAEMSIYGAFIEKYPALYEVKINENTSWSCEHGIERWRTDCGCRMRPEWTQGWRAPLREALDRLRDQLIPAYESEMNRYVADPWDLRNAFIDVILDRSDENVELFFERRMKRTLSKEEKHRVLGLLEMQRNSMLMYTSCGWFFDEISGIETTQILGYAGRAMQLAEKHLGLNLEPDFVSTLERAPSNIPEFRNGAQVYSLFVKPLFIDLYRVLAHCAISSLFSEQTKNSQIYCYTADNKSYEKLELGRIKLATGLTSIRSNITWNQKEMGYAVLHLGEFHINGGANEFQDEDSFQLMRNQIKEAFENNDIPNVLRLMDSHFRTHEFSLSNLFRDEQRKITQNILASSLEAIESSFRQVYETNYPIMSMMHAMRHPLPKMLGMTAEFILNRDMLQLLERDEINIAELKKLIEEIKRWGIEIDASAIGVAAEAAVLKYMRELQADPFEIKRWAAAEKLICALRTLHFNLVLWEAQNIFFQIGRAHICDVITRAESGDASASEWIEHTKSLSNHLGVKLI